MQRRDLVSNNYEEVIIFVHEHYKDVKEAHNMLMAIEDQQQAARINPRQGNVVPDKDYVKTSSSRIVVDLSHNDKPSLRVQATTEQGEPPQ